METAEEKEQNTERPDSYYWWLPIAIVTLFLLAFETDPLPIVTATATPQPTLSPPPTPTLEPVVIETAGEPNPDARLVLNVIVEDEAGRLMGATVTVTWLNGGFSKPLVFEEASDIKIPVPAGWTPVLVSVTKQGYLPVQQVFEARLAEDLEHEWVVRLVLVGDSA